MAGNQGIATENINEVILRLLKLKSGMEMDYQTYAKKIKVKLASSRMVGSFIPAEEDELLRNEFKRVRNKEGRFVILKSKKTRVSSPPPKSPSGKGSGNPPRTGAITKSPPKGKITKDRFFSTPRVEQVNVKDVTSDSVQNSYESLKTPLERIDEKLDSIIKTLIDIGKETRKKSNQERIESENKRRKNREKELESKQFSGIKNAVKGLLKPFQSIWDVILNFIKNVILGRILIKLINWIADPNNQGKIQSIIRFFGDHWPKLLVLYLRFGTGLGKFIGTLTGILIKGSIALIKKTAQLAASLGLKKAGKVASFLGGPKGKLLGAGLTIGANVVGMMAASNAIEGITGGNKSNAEDVKEPKVPGFSGGGWNKGFGNIFGGVKNFFGNMFNGLVEGPKGRDKVPAMLTDGEFVMSVGAVNKYGVETLEAMNAAGGGTNIPQIVNGITYAAGGGQVGGVEPALESWQNYVDSNPDLFKRGAKYDSSAEPSPGERKNAYRKAHGEYVRTFMRTGKPPAWANVKQKTTKVRQPKYSTTSPDVNVNINKETPKQKPSKSGALTTNLRQLKSRPKGYGGALQAAFAAMEFNDRKQAGQTTAQAGLGAAGSALGGSVGWMAGAKAGAVIGGGIGAMFGGIGAAPGAAIGSIIGGLAGGFGGASLGGKFADDVSGVNAAKERMGRGGIGGSIKGGYGLKKQEFKDAPKTMVMTDDKGRPFVGHKAMKNGKLTYVRPSKPGTGTTNPLEALGRMINPGAYKDSDAKVAMKNQKIAMVNALESFQKQGMAPNAQARMMKQMGGNLKDVQNDLNYRRKRESLIKKGELKPDGTRYSGREKMRMSISGSQPKRSTPKPLPKPVPKYNPAGGGMNGRRGSGSNPSRPNTQNPRSQSPTHSPRSTRTARSTLGINK